MLSLLIGGARSGKSRLALDLAGRGGNPVRFVATAEDRDEEMTARIDAHRRERPVHFETVEEPRDLAGALRRAPGAVVVDCLTLWVANLIESGLNDEAVLALAEEFALLGASHPGGDVIVVSNEVGSGIVPARRATRRYRDLLGTVNAVVARQSGTAWFVVAGRVLPLIDLGADR